VVIARQLIVQYGLLALQATTHDTIMLPLLVLHDI